MHYTFPSRRTDRQTHDTINCEWISEWDNDWKLWWIQRIFPLIHSQRESSWESFATKYIPRWKGVESVPSQFSMMSLQQEVIYISFIHWWYPSPDIDRVPTSTGAFKVYNILGPHQNEPSSDGARGKFRVDCWTFPNTREVIMTSLNMETFKRID